MTLAQRPSAGVTPDAPSPSTRCAHCDLPVPRALIDSNDPHQFCCSGCRAVYRAIHACGLDRYYRVRERLADDPSVRINAPSLTADRRFDDFDDPDFIADAGVRGRDGHLAVDLVLEGVHCAACLWLIENLPHVLPGVYEARLNLTRKVVRIVWDDDIVSLSRIARQLAAFGYIPHAITERSGETLRRSEDRRFLVHIGVAGALAGNVMLIAFALYGGMFHGIESSYAHLFRATSLGLTALALAWPGRVFFRSALAALRARTAHMDIPIALGLAAGMTWSTVATLRGTGEVYFDSITLLVFLLLVGRWIQVRQQRRSGDAVELLYSMTPRHARRLERDGAREVPVSRLRGGDTIEVRAGETIPVDGVVREGHSTLNTAWLTGEAQPVRIGPDALVYAGNINLGAPLVVRVDVAGHETRAGRLMALISESAQRRAPVVQLADRIAGRFVVAIIALATITAAVWWSHDPSVAIEHALALLIITCPCALGLATPLAIVAAIGRAARRGIMIKGGDVIEALTARQGIVFLDKTGTITEGRVTMRAWHGCDALRSVVARLEAGCAHPVAEALCAGLEDSEAPTLATPCFHDVEVLPNGVRGRVNGREVVVGSRTCVETHASGLIRTPGRLASLETTLVGRGWSPVFVTVDGRVEAVAAVGDSIRPDAAESVAQLRAQGWDVALLSGDHPDVVRAVGNEIGVAPDACHGAVSPEEKRRIVERMTTRRPTIMVGDGINDAAALAAATAGVAVQGGAEASLVAASVYMTRDGLAALPELINGARHTLRVIRHGLTISLAYNAIGCTLALGGLIDPLVAAILMPMSSLTVITLAYRARTFGDTRCP